MVNPATPRPIKGVRVLTVLSDNEYHPGAQDGGANPQLFGFSHGEAEQRFRSSFKNSQGLMCTHGLDGKIQTVNAAGASLVGYHVEEIVGRNLADPIAPPFRANLKGYMKATLTNGKATGLMHIQHKD